MTERLFIRVVRAGGLCVVCMALWHLTLASLFIRYPWADRVALLVFALIAIPVSAWLERSD